MRPLLPLMLTALLTTAAPATHAADPLIFISAFAPGTNGGIHAFTFDSENGRLKPLQRTAGVEHPFFLAVSPDQKYLYSIHAKTFGGKNPEEVAAYALEGRTGGLKLLNRQSTRGTASCYLAVDATGKTVLVANYTTGNVGSLPVRAEGSLGEMVSFFQHAGASVDLPRQKGPNAHSFVVSPDNRFAFAADLGIDQVLGYRLDAATAKLTPNEPAFVKAPPGAGPRHLAFHPNGRHLYAINELKNSVTLFDYTTATGTLIERQTIPTLPADFKGKSYCADLKITANGRFLYGTNRGHDSIATYRLGDDGRLTLLGIIPSLGKGPQNLALAADGKFLLCANMPGKNVVVFRVDPQTGGLTAVGEPITIPSPSCIMVLP